VTCVPTWVDGRIRAQVALASLEAHRDLGADDDVERARCRSLVEDLRRALMSAAAAEAPAEALKTALAAFVADVRNRSVSFARIFTGKADASPLAVATRLEVFEQNDGFAGLGALARAVVRRYDPGGDSACNGGHSDGDCPFAPTPCPNEECDAVVSKKALSRHDAKCPYKREPCVCGTLVQRRRKADHLAQDCSLQCSVPRRASRGDIHASTSIQ